MNYLLLLFLIKGSVFSVNGLGEDLAIFRTLFFGNLTSAQVQFTLRPEWNILNEDSKFRSIFWTNPFYFGLAVPLGKGLVLSLGNLARYNQTFDLYFEAEPLKIHLWSKGGIEEVFGQLNHNLYRAEIFFKGAYLFSGTEEVWHYTIDNYSVADTFIYKYAGHIFSAGLKVSIFSVSYEAMGRLKMEKRDSDTTISLPQLLALGLGPDFDHFKVKISVEHSFWHNRYSPTRFKIGAERGRTGFYYLFNPWYIDDVQEHGIGSSFKIPIRNTGFIFLNLNSSLKFKGSVRELKLVPELRLSLEEIFARRRK